MKRSIALTLLSSSLLFATHVSAAPIYIVIDDFSSGYQKISDVVVDSVEVSNSNSIRTLSSNLLAAVIPNQNTAEVTAGSYGASDPGMLDVTNGGGDDSEVKIDWNLASSLLPTNAINVSFWFKVLQSDGNPTDLVFSLNNTSLANFNIVGNTINQDVLLNLSPAQIALINSGGALQLKINGAAGWDLSLDAFGLSYELPPVSVSEPGSLALLAVTLAGCGLRRRKFA